MEKVERIDLDSSELRWAARVGVDPEVLQEAHAQLILEGKESKPVTRSVRAQKIKRDAGGSD